MFNAWLKDHLLPTLKPGMTIIMDNARFHKSPETKELIEAEGCKLLFLPPYSPDLNPIEHKWFPLKNDARKIMRTFLDLTSAVETAIIQNC
ncbi:MAG: transposase [Rickettsiales bacterium]